MRCMLELVSFHTGVIFEINILVNVGVGVRCAFWFNKDVRFAVTFYILRCSTLLIWLGRLFFFSLVRKLRCCRFQSSTYCVTVAAQVRRKFFRYLWCNDYLSCFESQELDSRLLEFRLVIFNEINLRQKH